MMILIMRLFRVIKRLPNGKFLYEDGDGLKYVFTKRDGVYNVSLFTLLLDFESVEQTEQDKSLFKAIKRLRKRYDDMPYRKRSDY